MSGWNGTKTFVQGRWGFGDANKFITENLESCYNFHQAWQGFSPFGDSQRSNDGVVAVSTTPVLANYFSQQRADALGPPPDPYRLFVTLVVAWPLSLGANTLTIRLKDLLSNDLAVRSVTIPGRGLHSICNSFLCDENTIPGFVVSLAFASGGPFNVWHGGSSVAVPLV